MSHYSGYVLSMPGPNLEDPDHEVKQNINEASAQ